MRFEWDGPAVHKLADLVVYQSVIKSGFADRKTLSGIEYMMVSPEFRNCRWNAKGPIVVCFGGADMHGLTIPTVQALARLGRVLRVVVGPAAPIEAGIALEDYPNVYLYDAPPSLAPIFDGASLFVGALGMTTYEALAAGLPCAVVNWTPDHERTTEALSFLGVKNLGLWDAYDPRDAFGWAGAALDSFVVNFDTANLSKGGKKAVDCGGVAKVAEAICRL